MLDTARAHFFVLTMTSIRPIFVVVVVVVEIMTSIKVAGKHHMHGV